MYYLNRRAFFSQNHKINDMLPRVVILMAKFFPYRDRGACVYFRWKETVFAVI